MVVSAYAAVPDITKVATPDIKAPGESRLHFHRHIGGQVQAGGFALAQVYKQMVTNARTRTTLRRSNLLSRRSRSSLRKAWSWPGTTSATAASSRLCWRWPLQGTAAFTFKWTDRKAPWKGSSRKNWGLSSSAAQATCRGRGGPPIPSASMHRQLGKPRQDKKITVTYNGGVVLQSDTAYSSDSAGKKHRTR